MLLGPPSLIDSHPQLMGAIAAHCYFVALDDTNYELIVVCLLVGYNSFIG